MRYIYGNVDTIITLAYRHTVHIIVSKVSMAQLPCISANSERYLNTRQSEAFCLDWVYSMAVTCDFRIQYCSGSIFIYKYKYRPFTICFFTRY